MYIFFKAPEFRSEYILASFLWRYCYIVLSIIPLPFNLCLGYFIFLYCYITCKFPKSTPSSAGRAGDFKQSLFRKHYLGSFQYGFFSESDFNFVGRFPIILKR